MSNNRQDNDIIGYMKHGNFIITIYTDKKTSKFISFIKNPVHSNFVKYSTDNIEVIKIEDLTGTECELDIFKVKQKYYDTVYYYYLDRDAAFYSDFIKNKNWLAFTNGYCGIIKEFYVTGELMMSCFYINDKPEGEMIFYNIDGNVTKKMMFINGEVSH